MFKFNRIAIAAFLVLLAAAPPASASAASARTGAIVFSMVKTERVGAELEGKAAEVKLLGGLYAAKNGHFNQLTEDPTDTEPSFSADGRTIAFVRSGDIWAMRADGTGQRQLTSGPEIDGHPVLSLRGNYVLFERRMAAGAPRDLYTVSVGGGRQNAVMTTVPDEHEAHFAPDGKTIAFVRSETTAGGGVRDTLFSVRPGGAGLRHLPSGGESGFAPRYFGSGIVFSRGQSGEGPSAFADIYTVRRDGTKLRPLLTGAGSAYVEDVSPDGRLVLFRRDQGLWVKPIGHARARKLTEVADGSRTNAVFSSDGRRIAAFVATEDGESLSAVNVATRRKTDLAEGFDFGAGEGTTIGPVIAWQPVRR